MSEKGTTDVLPERGLTETYVVTLQPGENWVIWRTNEALLKEFERGDPLTITSFCEADISQRKEVLKQIESFFEMLPSQPSIRMEKLTNIRQELINRERKENLRVYYERKTELYQRYSGRYVVIAKGEVQAVGESFDDLRYVSLDANHRFIFKIEPKEKVAGTFRWPIKRK